MENKNVFHCDFGCDEDDCGHNQCEVCGNTMHGCAGCGYEYCECMEYDWAVGRNGITYCSQYCVDRYADGGVISQAEYDRLSGREHRVLVAD